MGFEEAIIIRNISAIMMFETVKDISVIGLGKLGLCLAVVLAHTGFRVFGVDTDGHKVEVIQKGISPIYEPGLEGLMGESRNLLKVTTSLTDAIGSSLMTFVVLPTPSTTKGDFSLEYLNEAMIKIGDEISRKESYHTVVVTSTVSPLSMDTQIRPTLEKYSGKKCGEGFGLCYSPAFIAIGDVIKGLKTPDFVLIGESDPGTGDLVEAVLSKICTNHPSVCRMNFASAEIAKIALNSYVTMKISFANNLGEICEKVPGANADLITNAIGLDKRIGTSYLRAGLGYAGFCFPRDNKAYEVFANNFGIEAKLANDTHKINLWQLQRLISIIRSKATDKKTRVGVLGLTYKPNTDAVEESQSLKLAQELSSQGLIVHVYDPIFKPVSGGLIVERSASDCVTNTEICVLATNWPEFKTLDPTLFRDKIVIDCWRVLGDSNKLTKDYFAIGLGWT